MLNVNRRVGWKIVPSVLTSRPLAHPASFFLSTSELNNNKNNYLNDQSKICNSPFGLIEKTNFSMVDHLKVNLMKHFDEDIKLINNNCNSKMESHYFYSSSSGFPHISPGNKRPVISILASDLNGGIGKGGKLPWKIPEDTKYFSYVMTAVHSDDESNKNLQNGILMGKRTWESLPAKIKPLKNIKNCIISKSLKNEKESKGDGSEIEKEIEIFNSCEEAINYLSKNNLVDVICIGGGAGVYDEIHESQLADLVYWTRVISETPVECDAKVDLNKLLNNYEIISISKTKSNSRDCTFDFVVLQKKRRIQKNEKNHEIENEFSRRIEPINRNDFMVHKFGFEILQKKMDERNLGQNYKYDRNIESSGLSKYLPHLKYSEHEELQYLEILNDIIENGIEVDDRTGVGTFERFGKQMRFSLRDSFPLLTTKRVFWKGVVEELLWFIKGSTNANSLSEKGVKIWEGNGSREFLDSRGLKHRAVGDLGPIYGFQWRHFNAPYEDFNSNYEGQGIDQLADVINKIKTDPNSRRLIFTAWNPSALSEMALPPCHIMVQFIVDVERNELSCLMFQRSADWGLGVPFNIASYSLLTLMIAQVTGLKPGEFIHSIGSAHVYKNHVEHIKDQLRRDPYPFPIVKLNSKIKDIDSFTRDDILLFGYNCHPTIKMELAV